MNARKLYRRLYRRRSREAGRTYMTVRVPPAATDAIEDDKVMRRATGWAEMIRTLPVGKGVMYEHSTKADNLVTWTITANASKCLRAFCGAFSREWPVVVANWQSARMLRCDWPYEHTAAEAAEENIDAD